DTPLLLNYAMRRKADILFEGAQGTFLDIDFGTYPFVTSSSATSGGASTGSGVAPAMMDRVVGVAKAYTTRVGEGPFPTEFSPGFDKFIRNKGNEFGATTGRPRRCGWFDSVMVKEAVLLNGISELAVMKLDILEGLKTVKICTAYKYKGKSFREFPRDFSVLKNARPLYKDLPGWPSLTRQPRRYKELHRNARDYLSRIQDILNTRISMISIGSARRDTIFV
ncbi:MAG: adenylosuccinate synthetase, partial [Candidatus Omnitrophica bacterium]|nr:adenylosuccinate synthetase [Candidatus Omnitrophota bacterium]